MNSNIYPISSVKEAIIECRKYSPAINVGNYLNYIMRHGDNYFHFGKIYCSENGGWLYFEKFADEADMRYYTTIEDFASRVIMYEAMQSETAHTASEIFRLGSAM